MEIFDGSEAFRFLFRWLHILVGVLWIGLLYYFNFVQVPSFAEMDGGARNNTIDKLVPRALWYFRWAAALTVLTGLIILGLLRDPATDDFSFGFTTDYWGTLQGTSILTGGVIGIIMFLNVWLVIWPNQKVVIANARNVAAGGEADPAAAAAGRKGLLASRANALFSIPMVFYMTFTAHFADRFDPTGGRVGYAILVIVVVGLLEANALGLIGGTGPGPLRSYMETVPNVIIAGFVMWAVLYFVGWEALIGTP
ncbi:MAG TPA: urate hydroxylase PuuD [Acidimicrobiia bacterium]|nr:urate hydroxylase PuuD [Acidimicrobiia bacterium]